MNYKKTIFVVVGLFLILTMTTAQNAKAESYPSVPNFPSPVNLSTGVSISPTVSWANTVSSGGWYHLYYKKSSEFSYTPVSNLTNNSYTLSGLSQNTTYNWSVRACNIGVLCSDSETWSFTTGSGTIVTTTLAPTLSFSTNTNQVYSGGSATLIWSSTNTTSCSAVASPLNTQWVGTKTVSGYEYLTNITATTNFALTCTGTGGSVTQSATVSVIPSTTSNYSLPAIPINPIPYDQGLVGTTTPLYWQNTVGSGGWYNFFYKKNSDYYWTPVPPVTASSYTLSNLATNTIYNWKVQACNTANLCSDSPIWSFTTSANTTFAGCGASNVACQAGTACVNGACISSSSVGCGSTNIFCQTGTTCVSGVCVYSTSGETSCNSSSYNSYVNFYDFGTIGGTLANLCGNIQYFKVAIPQNQICDLKWILYPDANSDYDLYTRWDSGILDRYNYKERSFYGRGQIEEISRTRVYGGSYYAMAYKEANVPGFYSMTAALTNCSLATSTTPISTPSPTSTSSSATPTPPAPIENSSQISQMQSQITQLLAQINQLKSQLQTIQAGQNTSTSTTSNINNNIGGNWCYSFTKNLRYGDSGEDAKALQIILQKEGLYSGKIGGNFGTLTRNAVIVFQKKYLVSAGLATGTGFVGEQTLNKINELYSCE